MLMGRVRNKQLFFLFVCYNPNSGEKSMEIELLNNDNISDVIKIQKDLFQLENGMQSTLIQKMYILKLVKH